MADGLLNTQQPNDPTQGQAFQATVDESTAQDASGPVVQDFDGEAEELVAEFKENGLETTVEEADNYLDSLESAGKLIYENDKTSKNILDILSNSKNTDISKTLAEATRTVVGLIDGQSSPEIMERVIIPVAIGAETTSGDEDRSMGILDMVSDLGEGAGIFPEVSDNKMSEAAIMAVMGLMDDYSMEPGDFYAFLETRGIDKDEFNRSLQDFSELENGEQRV